MNVADVATAAATMNSQRSDEKPPLRIFHRSFVQFLGPTEPLDEIVPRLTREAVAARRAGFEEVVLEHNFWDAITGPDDWLAVPGQFLPVLDAARAAS